MSLRYHDKVAVVTGGSKGIGRGIVRVFVENGAKVAFCGRESAAGEALEAELNKTGPGSCKFVRNDISKEEDIKRLIAVTVEQFGHIDCLVNNAGWHPPHKPTDDTTAEEFRDLLNLNLVSYFLTSKVNFHSFSMCYPTYESAKETSSIFPVLWELSVRKMLRRMLPQSISPGNVMTPLWEQLAAQTPDAAATIKMGENAQLMGRMGTEAECGLAALYLAAEATFCTGIDLLLSGGAELNYGFKSQIQSSQS
ncbi:17-beta-hydroxysteroid dehydrogenase 14 isoform X2 [Pelmatolapia mariae]|uniref:17-beta-hydroxysteroid dehydrogenase 14 isoform X2 n=1 Tax=Pelmatolapia mariae TaxID=158779 RepID=UPI002FE64809